MNDLVIIVKIYLYNKNKLDGFSVRYLRMMSGSIFQQIILAVFSQAISGPAFIRHTCLICFFVGLTGAGWSATA